MAEKEYTIPIPGTKKYIYVRQNGSLTKPLILYIHGWTGSWNDHHGLRLAHEAEAHGFSAARILLYHWEPDARTMTDTTLETHARDIDTAVEYFRRKHVRKIFLVGHSYGGTSILLSSNKDFDGVTLWDPTFEGEPFEKRRDHLKYISQLHAYRVRTNYDALIGKAMHDESLLIPWDEMLTNNNFPVKIIAAGKSELLPRLKKMYQRLAKPKQLVVLKSASHDFSEQGMPERLMHETFEWIKESL